jgi:hypothetical protein
MSDPIYGRDEDETLRESPEDVLDRWIDDVACEDFEQAASRVTWPMKVRVYRRANHWRERNGFAAVFLERILDDLNEEFGDPDGDGTKPTDAMKRAALSFVDVVFKEFEPWACEPTMDFVMITREEAEQRWKEIVR